MHRIALALPLLSLFCGPTLAHDSVNRSFVDGRNAIYDNASPVDTADHRHAVVAPTLAAWTAALSRSLAATIQHPPTESYERPAEGVARVRFLCSESGAPTGLELVQGSRDRRIDRAALAAVQRIKTLHPLPTGLKPDQRYVAVLVFARSKESLKDLTRTLRRPIASRAADRATGDIALVAMAGRSTS